MSAEKRTAPPEVLARVMPGHNVEWDAVRGERWTCTTCRRAVLREGNTIYGSATEKPCDNGALLNRLIANGFGAALGATR